MAPDIRLGHLRCILIFVAIACTEAFYIPGWSIKTYRSAEAIPLLVNKIYSDNTQLQYAYYELPFVCPPSGIHHAGSSLLSGQSIPLNLGEVLRGDRISQSDIEIIMGQDSECKSLCTRTVTREGVKRAKDLIKDGYVVEWIVDNLPGATSFVTADRRRKYYASGFKLGYVEASSAGLGGRGMKRYFVNNHLTIVLRHRKAPGKAGEGGEHVIVGFEVYTKSVGPMGRSQGGCPANVSAVETKMELYLKPNVSDEVRYPHGSWAPEDDANVVVDDGATLDIPYTYSIYFREDDKVEWAHRWDPYFVNQEDGSRIHWLAIINSLIISGLLSGIVAMILARTILGEFKSAAGEEVKFSKRHSRHGSEARTPRHEKSSFGLLDQGADVDHESDDELLEDVAGWKRIHADVFRPPAYGHILAPLIGSGMQLLFMFLGLMLLSAVGILNPSFRGGFISVGGGLFIFAGLFSGYFSSRMYKTFHGTNIRRNTFITALLFPGLLFSLFSILNIFVWARASSTALPFTTLIAILLLWLFIQVPLVYLGSLYGYHYHGAYTSPFKTVPTSTKPLSLPPPRPIPPQPWYIRAPFSILLGGLIPFAIIFIELLFIFASLWSDKSSHYYLFGFLSIISILLLITIAEVTVVSTYVRLCNEDWQGWWWGCFASGAGIAIWVWGYCWWFFWAKMHVRAWGLDALLYFAYTGMGCVVLGVGMGTVGFVVGYAFLRRIYGAIKID